MSIGNEIKKALKKVGIKATCQTYKTGSARVKVIDGDIKEARKIAKQFEIVSYDKATGEVLSGANIFVFVEYHQNAKQKVDYTALPVISAR